MGTFVHDMIRRYLIKFEVPINHSSDDLNDFIQIQNLVASLPEKVQYNYRIIP
jgi:hypothetical protein